VRANALLLGTSGVGGNLTATAATGGLTQNGVLTVGGTSAFTASTAGQSINVGSQNNALTGAVTLNTSGAGDAAVRANALVLGTSGVGRNLTASSATGGLTQTGVLTVGGTSAFTASTAGQSINVGSQNNALTGAVTLNTSGAGDAAVRANALVLGTSGVGRNLTASSATGGITQNGVLTVGGTSAFTASTAGQSIDVSTQNNALTGAVALNTTGAGNAAVRANALLLGASGVGGNLTASAATGGLTQNGVLTVGGTSSFTASTAGQSIDVSTQSNALTGAVSLNTSGAGDAAVRANALVLGTSGVGRNLTASSATGGITQNGVLTVGGTSAFTASTAGQSVDVGTQNNALTGAVTLNTSGAGNAAVRANTLLLATSGVGGNLTASSATGGITQNGVLTVGGTSAFTASTAGQSIDVSTQSNALTGAVSLNTSGAGDAAVRANALVLGTSGVGRNLAATAVTGGITQSGVLTVGGTSTFLAAAAGQSINLSTQTNVFQGAVEARTSNTAGTGSISLRAQSFTGVNAGAMGDINVTSTSGNIGNLYALSLGGNITANSFGSLGIGGVDAGYGRGIGSGGAAGNVTLTAGGAISSTQAFNAAATTSFDSTNVVVRGNNVAISTPGTLGSATNYVGIMASNLALTTGSPNQAFYSVMGLNGSLLDLDAGQMQINGSANPALWPATQGVFSSVSPLLTSSTFVIGSGTPTTSFARSFVTGGGTSGGTTVSQDQLAITTGAIATTSTATNQEGTSSLNGILGATPDASISLFNIVGVCLPPDQRDDEAAAAQESCKATTSLLPQRSPFEMVERDTSLVAAVGGAPRTR
jgi:hypothetical protein